MLLCLNPFRSGRCLSTAEGLETYAVEWVSIPFDQGDVFRRNKIYLLLVAKSLNPFRSGRCLSTNSIWKVEKMESSQSLSIRAMSFDLFLIIYGIERLVSIPFDQGDVFRHSTGIRVSYAEGLNPFRSGRCLSTCGNLQVIGVACLNPFRSGRCLSTLEL